MKKYNYIIAIIVAIGAVFCSCSDFLEEHNRNDLSADNGYYDTEEGFESLINSCYTTMRLWGGKAPGIALGESGTDILAPGGKCDYPTLALYQTDLNGTVAIFSEYFNRFYKAINICNTAIAHAQTVDADDALKKQREAEARFLRAYYYWLVAETFGDTYYSDQPSEHIVTEPQKTSVADIYTHIFDDLDFCINSDNCLPTTQSEGGRVTLWAAKAFKARLLLTRASETGDTQLYEQAYTMAKDVVDNGPFELNKDFSAVFDMRKQGADGNGNLEVIWYVDYSSENQLYNGEFDNDIIRSGGNNSHLSYCMEYDTQPGLERSIEYGRPFVHYMPTRYLLDLYDDCDQRLAATFQTLWIANKEGGTDYPLMHVGDTAIWATRESTTQEQKDWAKGRYQIIDRDVMYNADGTLKNQKQYMAISKFADPTRETVKEDRSTRDAFMIRLAEMYLIIAEAGGKCGKADALEYMNTLRRTRAVSGHEAEMEVTQADIEDIDFILDERGRELAGEQLRWFDLKRMGEEIFLRRIKTGNPDAGKNVKAYHMLRPFPQDYLDAITNKEEFKQNEGY